MARSHTFLTLALGCLLAAGCGGGGSEPVVPGSVPDAGRPVDLGDASDIDVDTDADTPCDNTFPSFHDGMTQKAGDLTVKLMTVDPAPPRQQVANSWALQAVNADGTPATGFTVTVPDSYMPAHNHHGRQPPKIVMGTAPGSFSLNAIDFFMRGPWQVTFTVTPTDGKQIVTTFQICVD